jgi:hypothetical protein
VTRAPGLNRNRLRAMHLVFAVLSVAFVYTPLMEHTMTRALLRGVVVPALALSGMVMWKLPLLRRRLARARAAAVAR